MPITWVQDKKGLACGYSQVSGLSYWIVDLLSDKAGCLDWVRRGFEHAQLEMPPADVLEEKVGVGLDLLFWNSGEQMRENIDLRIKYVFVWTLSDGFCLLNYKCPQLLPLLQVTLSFIY